MAYKKDLQSLVSFKGLSILLDITLFRDVKLRVKVVLVYCSLQETAVTSTSPRSGEVEAIKIHDLVPRCNEVTHKLLLRVVTRVDFGNSS